MRYTWGGEGRWIVVVVHGLMRRLLQRRIRRRPTTRIIVTMIDPRLSPGARLSGCLGDDQEAAIEGGFPSRSDDDKASLHDEWEEEGAKS